MRRRRSMGAISLTDPRFSTHISGNNGHGAVVEEIEGLIRVFKDGFVERFPVVPHVPASVWPEQDVVSGDVTVDHFHGVWARFYAPKLQRKAPLLVYFHGGGFCVGSAAWRSYHEFLAKLASKAGCLIMSVNYRLAPENRLPAAFEDGVAAVNWVRLQARDGNSEHSWWSSRCNFSKLFVGGDSAGGCIAHNVAATLGAAIAGLVLIQPFFGGEVRTSSEMHLSQPRSSALSLRAADAYWRLALPPGANRDHPWCNPLSKELETLGLPATMVCVAEMDILKDRNLEYCAAMKRSGKSVESVLCMGVGHAFQILRNYPMSQMRTLDMIARIKDFFDR